MMELLLAHGADANIRWCDAIGHGATNEPA